MTVFIAVGKRSEIVKTAPIIREMKKRKISFLLVDVRQQRGWFMKGSHYLELNYPKPHYTIEFRGSSIGELTSSLLNIIEDEKPRYVLAAGYSETTLSAVIASNMAGLPFLHVESGYRTYNLGNEEEVRRQAIDSLSTICYAPTRKAYSMLLEEGSLRTQTIYTGSTTIDSLIEFIGFAREHSQIIEELELEEEKFYIITLHKSENISEKALREILEAVRSMETLFIMPVHPKTREALHSSGLYEEFLETWNILMVEPLDYIDFIALEYASDLVVTDSGTVSEEAAYLRKPLVIIGETTRSELVRGGLAVRADPDKNNLIEKIRSAEKLKEKKRPASAEKILGDGTASEKIVDHLGEFRIEFNPRIKFNYKLGFPSFKVVRLNKPLREIFLLMKEGSHLISAVKKRSLIKNLDDVPEEALILVPHM